MFERFLPSSCSCQFFFFFLVCDLLMLRVSSLEGLDRIIKLNPKFGPSAFFLISTSGIGGGTYIFIACHVGLDS